MNELDRLFVVTLARPDAFLSHWLAFPISRLTDNAPDSSPVTIQVRTGDQPLIVETVDGSARARPGIAEHPDAVLVGAPEAVMGVLRGQLDLAEAERRGLRAETRVMQQTYELGGQAMGAPKQRVEEIVTSKALLGRSPSLVDTAKLISFLASSEANAITGAIVNSSCGQVLD